MLACKPFVKDQNGELLAIALTARDSGVRASSLLRLSKRFNDVIALDFDLTCTARLEIYDSEREQRLLEAVSGGLFTKALNTAPPPLMEKKRRSEGSF